MEKFTELSENSKKWQTLSRRVLLIGTIVSIILFIATCVVWGVNAEAGNLTAAIVLCVVTIAFMATVFAVYFFLNGKALKQIEQERIAAENANRAKNEFLSDRSRKIRTPMNAILGMSAIAAANIEDTQKVRECLEKISVSSRNLLNLMNDVLDVSKIESGEMTPGAESANGENPQPPQEEFSLEGRRILIAEDNELNWEIANTLLTEAGLICDHAENGEKCLDKFFTAKPGTYDAILMDLRMPVMDGIEATKFIRSAHPKYRHIPIIAMTADAFSADVAKCLECGMNAHISKPIDIELVKATLKKFINKKD